MVSLALEDVSSVRCAILDIETELSVNRRCAINYKSISLVCAILVSNFQFRDGHFIGSNNLAPFKKESSTNLDVTPRPNPHPTNFSARLVDWNNVDFSLPSPRWAGQ
jgi:hypothetical protein